MRHNKNLLIVLFLDQRVGRYRFAETHLAVPEHPISFSEDADSLIDAVHLLITELNSR